MTEITILYVGGKTAVTQALEASSDLTLLTAQTIEEAEQETEEIDIIVSDFSLPDGTAIDLFDRLPSPDRERGRVIYTDEDISTILDVVSVITFDYVDSSETPPEDLVDYLVNIYEKQSYVSYPVLDDVVERETIVNRISIPADTRNKLDEEIDDIAEEFGVSIAYIALMKRQKQEFIARCSLDLEETGRHQSICTFAMIDDGVTVIDDVLQDARFKDNDLLKEIDIEWYAGVNLTVEGYVIGTLCLLGHEKQEFDEESRRKLQKHGERIEAILEEHIEA